MTSSEGPSSAVLGPGRPVDREELPDRIWTLPNALSVLRLLGVPLFLWLLLGPHADGWAILVLALSGVSDWADGKLARLLDQSSRLGALLDPAADRLYIVATLVALALREVVPLWLVAVLVGRELVLGLLLLVLRHYGYPPLQVHYLGKAATFLLLYAFPCLLLADAATAIAPVVLPIAWALTIWGTALYLLAGLFYVIQVVGLVRAVTAPVRGGGLRSMGASLLDQVLAETLDPAYLQAAEARAERERAAEAAGELPEPAARARRRRLGGQVLVAVVLALAGLLVAVTYRQASAGSQGRAQVREALVTDIGREQHTTEGLAAQLDALRATVDRTRDEALRATGAGQAALDQLAAAEQGAAAVAVTGPGLRVTLADAPSGADADPVGARPTAPNGSAVRDSDLQLVVNALWAAGADAVSIDGQRLGPTSTIRTAGEAILVDFQPVTSPYQVDAIGGADALSKRFLADPGVQALAVVAQSYGLRFDFAKEGHLSLPAAAPSALHSARPLPARSVPATAGPTPSPGG